MRIADPARRSEYILKADRESASPTVFVLRRLTREQMLDCAAAAPISMQEVMRIGRIVTAAKAEARELNDEENAVMKALEPQNFAEVKRALGSHALAIELGVTEIRSLTDEHGAPLAMSAADFARAAPADVVSELGEAVVNFSQLDEAERKN